MSARVPRSSASAGGAAGAGLILLALVALMPLATACDGGCPGPERGPQNPAAYCGSCDAVVGQALTEEGCVDVSAPPDIVVCTGSAPGSDAVTCYQDQDTGERFYMSIDSPAIAKSSNLVRCPVENPYEVPVCPRD